MKPKNMRLTRKIQMKLRGVKEVRKGNVPLIKKKMRRRRIEPTIFVSFECIVYVAVL